MNFMKLLCRLESLLLLSSIGRVGVLFWVFVYGHLRFNNCTNY